MERFKIVLRYFELHDTHKPVEARKSETNMLWKIFLPNPGKS